MAFQKIHQGHYGFLWCASSNGLYRYDGYQFKPFKRYVTHSDSILSDYIWDILEDAQHNIWLATYDGGINKWNRKTGKFDYYVHAPDDPGSLAANKALRLMMDKDGFLWAIVALENGVPALERLDPRSGRVQHFRYQPENALSLNSDTISLIAPAGSPLQPMIQSQDGQIWVAARRGVNLYVPGANGFRTIPGPWAARREHPFHLYESPAVPGLIWILAASEGLDRGHVYRLDSKTLEVDELGFSSENLLTYAPTGIYHPPGRPEELWLSSRELCRIGLRDGSAKVFAPELQPDASLWQGLRDSLFCISPGPSGQPWLVPLGFPPAAFVRGSEKYYIRSGIYRLDTVADRLELLNANPTQPNFSFGMVYSMASAPDGNTWIGCFPGFYQLVPEWPGQRLQPAFENFELWEAPAEADNLSAWAAVERPAGILWVATFKGGLKRVNLHNGKVSHFRHEEGNPSSIAHDKVYALFVDEQEGRLWIGTEKGLDWVSLSELDSGSITPVFHHLLSEERLSGNEVTSITRGPDGFLWAGTIQEGLLLLDAANERIVDQFKAGPEREGFLNSSFINMVYTDSKGRSWVATGMGGLCQALPGGEGRKSYSFQCHLDGMYIVDIFENNDGKLWLAAMNYGIAIFDPETGTHELWNMENHLQRGSVLGIEQDKAGNLWFSSLGLTRYNPRSGMFRSFGRSSGIQDEDPGRLLLTLKDGRMVYSSINGWLQVFDPAEIRINPNPPRVVVTGVQYYSPEKKGNVLLSLDENIEVASEITLNYHQQPFSIQFVGLEFTGPGNIRYATMLEGYEEHWNYTSDRVSERYLQVPPGQYTFLLKAANSDGQWMESPLRLKVTIAPPWWKTRAAYLAYGLLLGLLFYALFAFQRRRLRLRAQLEFEQREAARLKELDVAKTRFFTDIAHELRTPLTVIRGVAGQVLEKPQEWLEKGVEMIQRNARQLYLLANQLLELSKLETGSLKVNMIQADVIPFIRAIMDPFATLATAKGIRWNGALHPEQLVMDFEPDKLQKIVSNLLSNALKFTPEGKSITARSRQVIIEGKPHFEFTVEDTGRGIPPEELPFVFDRGFRGKGSLPGAGIGLALARELAFLFGGTIEARSPKGAGASFRVLLPIHREAPADKPAPLPPMGETLPEKGAKAHTNGAPHTYQLLIVEDNGDLVEYLSAILNSSFRLLVARNGQEGLNKAIQKVPDIIISDVMMPEMDGIELCRQLKANLETSHIPVLLLTARTDVASRTEGYQAGADAYLPKPFDRGELFAQLRQLLDNRKRLQEYFSERLPLSQPDFGSQPLAGQEEEFLLKAREAVVKNISVPEFGPKQLCRELNMSKTQLHNKLRALTGRSTALFIRYIRLTYAKEALERTPGLTVKQAAYDFGFKDPNYFSRIFKKEFGVNPTDIHQ
ncbi:MAG: response regulator [Phaeodactylibacter sp.]|nr:response regulator [Phaeodactylibacter sp.]